jgi:tyrosine-protein phosphatase SIW14
MTFSSSFPWRYSALSLALLCAPVISLASEIQALGVPNFFKVNDQVYRGAQPTDAGFQSLAKLGIRTIIDLRLTGEHSQADEEKVVEAAGMKYVSIPMQGMSTPAHEKVSRMLALLENPDTGPVFIHCQRGADRTGALIACYRIGHDGWQNKKALSEARSLGMSWYQVALQRYVLGYRAASPSVPPIAAAVAAP